MSNNDLRRGSKMVRFGDVVRNANLVERDPIRAGIKRVVGLDHLDPGNLHIRRWNSPEDNISFSRKFISGQTLFGKRRAYQRKVAFAEFEGICSGDILTFEPKDPKELLPELLPFICQTDAFFDYALGTSAGSLSPRTSWSALKEFEFPLPPIEEQKRIAEILWAADETVERYSASLHNVDLLLTSFREHVVNNANHPRIRLGQVITDIIAGKSVVGVNDPANDGELGVLKVSAIGRYGFVPEENKRLLSNSDFQPRYSVKRDSLLITRCNTMELVGRVCLTNKDYSNLMLCDKTLQIEIDEKVVNKVFIYEALKANSLRTQIMRFATGTGGAMKNMSQQDICNLNVPAPPIKVQSQAANLMMIIYEKRNCLLSELAASRALLTKLSNEFINGDGDSHV